MWEIRTPVAALEWAVSWSFPVDSYVLLNPLNRACAVVPAPAAARRGVVISAYAHFVTGVFHLLQCCLQRGELSSRTLKVDDAPIWRELPAPSDPGTAEALGNVYSTMVAGTIPYYLFSGFSHNMEPAVTLHGKLHWLDGPLNCHVQLLVFDTLKEEFGRMKAPRAELKVRARRICEITGKLCLLYLSWSMETMELWVLEDCTGQTWNLKRNSTAALGVWYSSLPLWNRWSPVVVDVVVNIGNEDDEIILILCIVGEDDNTSFYNVRLGTLHKVDVHDHETAQIKMHRESLVSAEVLFGTSACVVPETYPGIPLFLSYADDVAFAVCPRVPLVNIGKDPRVCMLSSLWYSSYIIFLQSSRIMRRIARPPCWTFYGRSE